MRHDKRYITKYEKFQKRFGVSLLFNIISVAVILGLIATCFLINRKKVELKSDMIQSVSIYSLGYGYGVGMVNQDLEMKDLMELWEDMYASDKFKGIIR